MNPNMTHLRVLAVDLRLRRFGFAVLEGPGGLLDCGARRWNATNMNDSAVLVRRRILRLLRLFAPSVMVVKKASRQAERECLVNAVQDEALQRSVEWVLVTRKEIRRAFAPCGAGTKREIATRIALLFPELIWKLPVARKLWKPEAHAMTIFDAVSLGLTYLSRFGTIFPVDREGPQSRVDRVLSPAPADV